ncbi:hypothetical protein NS220_08990, partial [Microbacterium testaceum]
MNTTPPGLDTLTGTVELRKPSLPTCPLAPKPHAHTDPSVANANEWKDPALTCVNTTPGGLDTLTGIGELRAPPLPNIHISPSPHAHTDPSVANPNEWRDPALTCVNTTPAGLDTLTGTREPLELSLPNCPDQPAPHAHTDPSDANPNECEPPALTCVNTTPAGLDTLTGTSEPLELSLPNRPDPPAPHAHTDP